MQLAPTRFVKIEGTEVSVLASWAGLGLATAAGGGSGQPASSGVSMSNVPETAGSGTSMEVDAADTSVGPSSAGPVGSLGAIGGRTGGTVTGVGLDAGGGAVDGVTSREAASGVGAVGLSIAGVAFASVPMEGFPNGCSSAGAGGAAGGGGAGRRKRHRKSALAAASRRPRHGVADYVYAPHGPHHFFSFSIRYAFAFGSSAFGVVFE